MLAEERRQKMVEMVGESATVTVSDLAQAFDTSESTIRRDLDRLDAAGKLVKVHGGAASVESAVAPAQSPLVTNELGMDEKRSLHTAEKRLIAAHAATLIGPEDFVYIDAGTSTLALVEALSEPATQALFATNSVSNALALTSRGCRTIVIGGNLKGLTEAIVGPGALDALSRHNFTKGFWGTNGVTPERGFTTPDPPRALGRTNGVDLVSPPPGVCRRVRLRDFALHSDPARRLTPGSGGATETYFSMGQRP